ncbi:GAF domain-containing protein [Haloechinothrix alba]|uniref:GAF domain-containing protein n=1 Tax=Haloechinothrix alba TaxID=664784 RepID=A0A238XQF1_9PSEU|nr:GAF domain-containing protein [Haloechinothrix alba]SNR60209.1 GAF domain-containing protein [Haloechinothrix alba]
MNGHALSELLHDPDSYTKMLQRVREAVLSGSPAPHAPRPVISESWQRSLAARVDPDDRLPPVVFAPDELDEVRQCHPLSAVLPLLRQNLVSIADEAEHIMIVTDAQGHILWREGATGVCHRADDVLLTEGVRWSEDVIGTNAMGTVLATDEPVQIHSAEHLVRTYHEWTCAAAPVHDPDSGELLGAVDVSGPLHTVHPAMLALVSATANLAEGQLRARLALREEQLRRAQMPHLDALHGEPGALLSSRGRVLATRSCDSLPSTVDIQDSAGDVVLPDGRHGTLEPLEEGFLLRFADRGARSRVSPRRLSLTFLTDGAPSVTVDGREVPVTLRHAEILTLLALNPGGMNAEKLALRLYGETGNPVTVRAEIHRLRTYLGADVMGTKPYRILADVDADFLTARRALRDGSAAEVVAAFDGPLLPDSESPSVLEERESLTALVRRTVLHGGDADALWDYWATSCGADDGEIVDTLCSLLACDDPRFGVARHHQRRLRRASS